MAALIFSASYRLFFASGIITSTTLPENRQYRWTSKVTYRLVAKWIELSKFLG